MAFLTVFSLGCIVLGIPVARFAGYWGESEGDKMFYRLKTLDDAYAVKEETRITSFGKAFGVISITLMIVGDAGASMLMILPTLYVVGVLFYATGYANAIEGKILEAEHHQRLEEEGRLGGVGL